MSLKLKKSNILYGTETPPLGWVILGVDENGNLVRKDDDGTYETVVKDSNYGIFLKLETDFLTIGNRMSGGTEALYSYSQGEYNNASGYVSSATGKYTSATNKYSYVHGEGKDKNNPVVSGGVASFTHMNYNGGVNTYNVNGGVNDGCYGNYSAILAGQNNLISSNSYLSSISGGHHNVIESEQSNILGGANNYIKTNSKKSVIIGGENNTINSTESCVVMGVGITASSEHGGALLVDKIFSTDGTINPSDARLKTQVSGFTKDELNASQELLNEIGTYNFLEIVGNKGIRIGMTVQRAIEIMDKNNLEPLTYSFIVKTKNYKNNFNDLLTDGIMYNFVYDELILFIMRGLSEKLNDISNRLDKIEKGGN